MIPSAVTWASVPSNATPDIQSRWNGSGGGATPEPEPVSE
jgi:hypothetical protein